MGGFLSLLRRIYLSVYNWTVFLGWLQVLYIALKTLGESGHEHVYDAVEKPLLLAQSAAFLEILHGLIGLVRSPITAMLPQIGSRLYLTWGILYSFPEVRTHILVSSLVISWGITEVIRYSFFGTKEALGSAPSFLLWLRYSAFLVLYPTGIASEVGYSSFLVLYPTGIASEVGLVYIAMPYIKRIQNYIVEAWRFLISENFFFASYTLKNSEKYCIRMPNKWNFSFDYYCAAIAALGFYIPGSPYLYSYMLGQRKKALSKSKRV